MPAPTETLLADRYRLGPLLGRGGMAEVYEAVDERLGRPVAVKLLRPEFSSTPGMRDRFEAEARSAARLTHPNVVSVFDSGEDAGTPFIVMERLPGETLGDRMADAPLDVEWLQAVAADVLGALGSAHTAGMVHRDVKPANILIAADGHAKVADFGIAKALEEPSSDLTGANQVLGTPAYLAPERVEGRPASVRSDLYAFGVVLYEALAGVKPFAGATPIGVAYAVCHTEPTPLTQLRPGVGAGLVAAVERAMDRDPDRRFETAAEMAAALGVAPLAAAITDPSPTMASVAAPPSEATIEMPVAQAVDDDAAAGSFPHGPRTARLFAAPGRRRPLLIAVLLSSLFVAALVVLAGRGNDAGRGPGAGVPSTTVPFQATTTVVEPATVTSPTTAPSAVPPGAAGDKRGKGKGKG